MATPAGAGPAAGRVRSFGVRLVAQVLNGALGATYLAIASHRLGRRGFAPLSVAWAAMFLLGTGLFLSIEQQLARALPRLRADAAGIGLAVRSATRTTLRSLAVVDVALAVAAPWAVPRLFDGEWGVYAALAVAVSGFALIHVARGTAAGLAHDRAWVLLLVSEGLISVTSAGLLIASGTESAGAYTLASGTGSLAAPVLVLALVLRPTRPERGRSAPTDPIAWPLVGASVLTALLISAGPLAVALLATPNERTLQGPFLTALVLARAPVMMFPLILSLVLPALSAAVAGHDLPAFRRWVRRIALITAGATVAAAVGAFVAGPWAVGVVFVRDFAVLDRIDVAALAASALLLTGALSLTQAGVAAGTEHAALRVWAAAAAGYVLLLVVSDDLLLRVELAQLGSAAIAVVGALLMLRGAVDAPASPSTR